MDDLVEFVSQRSAISRPKAREAVDVTLDFLRPHCSSLLKSSIEVLLQYPHLSEAEKDLLIATRVLFPIDSVPPYPDDELHD
ncbi:MAG: hypothetical protein WAS33_15665 [Candidatus Promineifilaceae bacterium]